MTLQPPKRSGYMQEQKEKLDKNKDNFLTKLYFEHQAKEAEKIEIERKQKLIKDAEIFKKELEILDDDKENIETKSDQLSLIAIKQDIIIDSLAKLEQSIIDLQNLIND